MKRSRYFPAAILGFSCLVVVSLAYGQRMDAPSSGTPRINQIMPVGGQAGTTVELRITGSDLVDVEGLHFNFPGVKVEAVGSEKTNAPPVVGKKGKGMVVPPGGLTTHTFNVTLPANAPLGIQDVRIITKAGISNPRAFVVGDRKEFVETEPNNDEPQANRIELNSTVNGTITVATDVDYFVFAGKKGQRVICSCLTTAIDSRLPAFLQMYAADGAYLGGNRNYTDNNALVDAVLPADGDYYVRICSFSYTQGGLDHFYRLTVTTAPWIDAVYPPVVEPGKDTQVTVFGRNLPGGKLDPSLTINDRPLETAVVTVKAPSDPMARQRLTFTGLATPLSSALDGFDFRIKNPSGNSDPYLLTYASAPVVLDTGDNDTMETAQKIQVPCVIAGRIEKKADRDFFAFSAKKGQVLYFEAFAERIGSPMDLFFQIRDDKGSLITEQDDTLAVMSPQFFTRSEDPLPYRFTAPSDGTFYLMVTSRDAFTQYGPRHLYTVRITADEPDFRLIAMPTSTNTPEGTVVNQAGGAAYNVYVHRFGNFNEEITLSGENLPKGVGLRPQAIGSGLKQAVVVIHAEPDAKPWAGPITIVGTATVGGKKLKREVRSATISWAVPAQNNNVPTITRLDRELVVAVRDKAAYSLLIEKDKIQVQQGDKISIPVKLVGNGNFKASVQIAAVGGPPQLISQFANLTPGQSGPVALDAKGGANTIPPGNYTIFLRGSTQPINPKQPAPKGTPPNIIQISMPVSVTIVPKILGKFTATPANAKVSLGKDVEVTVRLVRQFDLPLNLKVEAILPPNAKGITAKDATIKAGEEEAKLLFTVAPNAMIGQSPTITIRATAMFNDTEPVVHETKVTLQIAK